MKKLSTLRVHTEDVSFGLSGEISVRGLSFYDLSVIFRENASALEDFWRRNMKSGEAPEVEKIVRAMATELPDVVAQIIAEANDSPEGATFLKKMPLVYQINALFAILRLTVHSEAEVKKILEVLTQGLSMLTDSVNSVTGQNLPDLSEPSVK